MTDGGSPLRLGVVGAGAISQIVHVPILAEREDVDLAVLADTDIPKARSVAERFGVPETVDAEAVFGREDLDALVLCSPNHVHEEQAVRALEAGKHVFVERPMALTPEGAARVVAAARASGTVLVVGMPNRFRPDASALRSVIAGGDLGKLYAIRGSWLTRRVPVVRPTWRHDPSLSGGGALMDLGVPSLDLCLWFAGYPKVSRVTCVTTRSDFAVEDAATVMLETEGGIAISLEVSSRYFAREDRYYARVMGTEGSASLNPLEIHRQLGGRPLDVTPRQPRPRGGENPYTNAYRRQLDHFVRAASGRGEAPVPEEQVALMSVIQAAYRAASEGREVAP